MPRKLELEALESELAGLISLFKEAQEINDPVGILQYEQRIHELETEISALTNENRHLASIALYFGGNPVLGSLGIAADFAGRALENFQEIISKQFAKVEIGALAERGRVPHKELTTLMFTGVTRGSFGFTLDELTDQTQMFDTALKEMVSEVMMIIESAGSINDVVFDEASETLDPRTLKPLKEFFGNLESNKATVRLVDDVRDISLDEAAVHRAKVRIEATEIVEEDTEITGVLIGFLPEHRRFEIKIESGETIYGTATKQATEQITHALKNAISVIGKICTASINERTVHPLNRPPRLVYRLLEFTKIGEDNK
jgi:hypothetical protein